MSREIKHVPSLEKCQPLFREFCEVNNLKTGDDYFAIDYLFWTETLSLNQQLAIIRKYDHVFRHDSCNF